MRSWLFSRSQPGTRSATPLAQAAPQLKAETLANLHFRTIGPAAMSGRIVDIAGVEANNFTFYLASATGGLWKTTDNATTFAPVFFQQSGGVARLRDGGPPAARSKPAACSTTPAPATRTASCAASTCR